MNPIDDRESFNFKGAILIARSRSGVTENVRLADGQLLEVYYFKSGKIGCQQISQIDTSLTIRGEEPYNV